MSACEDLAKMLEDALNVTVKKQKIENMEDFKYAVDKIAFFTTKCAEQMKDEVKKNLR
jgi:hypothetical protein